MNKIDKLINELCPDGVEFMELWKLTSWDKKFNGIEKYKQKRIIKYPYASASHFKKIATENGNVKLLSTGNYIGWTTEKLANNNLCEGEIIAIPWGGKANVKYCNGKFVTTDNRIAISNNKEILLNKFLYYWMLNNIRLIESFYRGSGIKHPSMKKVLETSIPIPPIAIQQKIVKILDNFTELETQLNKELENRKKQYEHYRDELLCFGDDVERIKLGNLCKIGDGLHGTPKYDDTGKYYFINGNNLKKEGITFNNNTKKVDNDTYNKYGIVFSSQKTIFMSINGTIGSVSFYNNENIVLGKSVAYFNVEHKSLEPKFLYYFIQTNFAKKHFEIQKTGATIKNLGLKALREFKIPLPPLQTQQQITTKLDQFAQLITEIENEIKARKKQYEYYREQLLTFKEKQ